MRMSAMEKKNKWRILYIIWLGIVILLLVFNGWLINRYGKLVDKYTELGEKYTKIMDSYFAENDSVTEYICNNCGFSTDNVEKMNQHIKENKHGYSEIPKTSLNQVVTADSKTADLTKEMVVVLKQDCKETEYLRHSVYYRVNAVTIDSETGSVTYRIVIPVSSGSAERDEDSTMFEVISKYRLGPK
jgi:hypothetical protein